jgi:DNA-binding transcriptional regulator YiaG
MGRPRKDKDDLLKMKQLAREIKRFRSSNLLSQKVLAEVIGASRREVQYIEAGEHFPQERVLDAFRKLQAKYAAEGKSTGQRAKKAA